MKCDKYAEQNGMLRLCLKDFYLNLRINVLYAKEIEVRVKNTYAMIVSLK